MIRMLFWNLYFTGNWFEIKIDKKSIQTRRHTPNDLYKVEIRLIEHSKVVCHTHLFRMHFIRKSYFIKCFSQNIIIFWFSVFCSISIMFGLKHVIARSNWTAFHFIRNLYQVLTFWYKNTILSSVHNIKKIHLTYSWIISLSLTALAAH